MFVYVIKRYQISTRFLTVVFVLARLFELKWISGKYSG